MFELETVAFEYDFMQRTIGYGVPLMRGIEFVAFDFQADPTRLEFGIWMNFVPEPFKKIAAKAINYVLKDLKYLEKEFSEENKVTMILDMREFIKRMMYAEKRMTIK